jgi:hypothetical protein
MEHTFTKIPTLLCHIKKNYTEYKFKFLIDSDTIIYYKVI